MTPGNSLITYAIVADRARGCYFNVMALFVAICCRLLRPHLRMKAAGVVLLGAECRVG